MITWASLRSEDGGASDPAADGLDEAGLLAAHRVHLRNLHEEGVVEANGRIFAELLDGVGSRPRRKWIFWNGRMSVVKISCLPTNGVNALTRKITHH